MSRKLSSSMIAGLWCVTAFGLAGTVLAQQPPQGQRPRPANNANLQVQNLPPALNQLLQDWSQSSAKIKKLQGTHYRHVYDTVFEVDKLATGAFYYEAPGKGRIDLRPAPIKQGQVSDREGKNGKPYKLQPDRAERWICDGEKIWQVNDVAKQVDVFEIPKENQGANIMDGPMPFLFGMPPAKAKRRYQLFLQEEKDKKKAEQQAVLIVYPRFQIDAANWKMARVILSKENYLPRAVELTDPSGNLITTYIFGNFQINKNDPNRIQQFFGVKDADPFHPNLEKEGYSFKVHNGEEKVANAEPQIPSVAGLDYQRAQALLEKHSCTVKLHRGKAATHEKLRYVVYEQKPAAGTPLKKGQVVDITLYDKPPGRVPPVLGMKWKDAGQKLEDAGYKVKYLRGNKTDDVQKLYMVYQQIPDAGKEFQPGSEVELTLYDKKE